jgi:hypothetical protein
MKVNDKPLNVYNSIVAILQDDETCNGNEIKLRDDIRPLQKPLCSFMHKMSGMFNQFTRY